MLTTGRYKGSPVAEHLKHKARITPAMFDRWLAIWAATTDELMPPAAAAALQAKAARIAESLQLALFFRLGDPGHRGAGSTLPTSIGDKNAYCFGAGAGNRQSHRRTALAKHGLARTTRSADNTSEPQSRMH